MSKKTIQLLTLVFICGCIIGAFSAFFLNALQFVTALRQSHQELIYLIPVVGVLTAVVYQKFGKGSERGNNFVIDSVHKDVKAPFRMTFLTLVFTVLTHLCGGSAGREGTAVQMGGSITNQFSEWFHLDQTQKRIFVMSGISAGFGSVFGTPLAGAFFGMEVCFIGKLSYESILPCFIASFTADAVVKLFGVQHQIRSVHFIPRMGLKPMMITVLAAFLFGLTGKAFAVAIPRIKKIYKKKIANNALRALVASSVVLVVYCCFGLFRYEGLSTWMMDSGFAGTTTLLDPIYKWILTCLTLGAGFQGGEVTPLFDIGAALGGFIGQSAALSPSLFAAMGMIAVFGCATNTPIAAILLGIEMFGIEGIPYFVFAVIISYYTSGHSGIYSSQVIATSKSSHYKDHIGLLLSDVPQVGFGSYDSHNKELKIVSYVREKWRYFKGGGQ